MEEIAASSEIAERVAHSRRLVADVFEGRDDRLLCVVGPCSIHDPKAGLAYASELKKLSLEFSKDLLIVMRVYFEKPRTIVGWKGLINDPHLDGSFAINQGLRVARQLLLDLGKLEIPVGTEFLDPITPQFFADLVTWGAIGARTSESQVHRELASGLSMPVGFKNGTDGNVQIAVDAIRSSSHPHHFLSVTKQGLAAIVSTSGNPHCHVILRGGSQGPNFDRESVGEALKRLEHGKVPKRIMVDCSHANCGKDHRRQAAVATDLSEQIRHGNDALFGVMIESFLVAGRQELRGDKELVFGQSITDACVDLAETKTMLSQLAEAVRARRSRREKI
jgi:3-deoxy-7-phosphoheptulonate synthase